MTLFDQTNDDDAVFFETSPLSKRKRTRVVRG